MPGIVPTIPATTFLMIPPNGVIGVCFRVPFLRINERLPERNDDRATLGRTVSQLGPGMVSTSDGSAIVGNSAPSMPLICPVRPRPGGGGVRGTGYDVGGHSLALLADVGRARAKRQPRTPLNSEKTTGLRHANANFGPAPAALASASPTDQPTGAQSRADMRPTPSGIEAGMSPG
jgi:hypothetical protein